LCDGGSYSVNGNTYIATGIYYDTLQTVGAGCDSIIVTNLIVNPVYNISRSIQICDGQSYFAGGAAQTTDGVYVDSFTTAAGCDSIITTSLDVTNVIINNVMAHICEGQTYMAGGALQTVAGMYYDTTSAVAGCDSVIVTNLMLHLFTT
jgi:hypothetical protein